MESKTNDGVKVESGGTYEAQIRAALLANSIPVNPKGGILSNLSSKTYTNWHDLINDNSTFFAPVDEEGEPLTEQAGFDEDSAPMCNGDCAACQEDDEEYAEAAIEAEENRVYASVDSEGELIVAIDDQPFVLSLTTGLALAAKLDWALGAVISLDNEL